jgi:cytoskeletal protein CcmA (bactofilin family)
MANEPTESTDSATPPPAPEVLSVQSTDAAQPPEGSPATPTSTPGRPVPTRRRGTYRPSHRATFIGLGVIALILGLNAVIISLVINGQATSSSKTSQSQGEVTLSTATLNKLGVSKNTIGDSDQELIVGPNTQFNGKVTVASDTSIGGKLSLNGQLSATNGTITNLQAGSTAVSQLNVNGDETATNLNLRSGLTVTGVTRLQGAVTLSQLLTVNNNLTVAGNLAVGGTLSARSFDANSLVSDTTLTIGGHIITAGLAPSVAPGAGLGALGTVSISGNDAAGTIAVSVGVAGAGNGILAQVAFHSTYAHTPHVVVTAIGAGPDGVYVNRTSSGFSIGISNTLGAGGYAFDYIVEQ